MEDAGREPRVLGLDRVNRRHAVLIEEDFHRRLEAGNRELAVEKREGAADPPPSAHHGRNNKYDRQNSQQSFHACNLPPFGGSTRMGGCASLIDVSIRFTSYRATAR
jgi:hypothetical protein